MTTGAHETHRPMAALESGSVNFIIIVILFARTCKCHFNNINSQWAGQKGSHWHTLSQTDENVHRLLPRLLAFSVSHMAATSCSCLIATRHSAVIPTCNAPVVCAHAHSTSRDPESGENEPKRWFPSIHSIINQMMIDRPFLRFEF